jgi:hypothetical protein
MKYDYFKGLFFGVPGSGKTRLSYSSTLVPKMTHVLGFNLSGNPVSIRDYPADKYTIINLEAASNTTQIENTLGDAYDFLTKDNKFERFNSRFAQTFNITQRINTIVFDSLTDLNRVASQELAHINDNRFGKIPVTQNEIQDFNKLHSYLHQFCRELYSLEYHVIVTCLEMYDEKTNSFQIALTGKSSAQIPSYPYFVGRLSVWSKTNPLDKKDIARDIKLTGDDVKEVEVVLQSRPSMKVNPVKNQYVKSTAENGYMTNPTMQDVLELCKL